MRSMRLRLFASISLAAACTVDKDPSQPVTGAASSVPQTGAPGDDDDDDDDDASVTAPTSGAGESTTGGASATADTTSGAEVSTGEDSGDETSPAALSHAADIVPIWSANCVVGCHMPGGISEYTGVILTAEDAYDAIVGVPSASVPGMDFVAPGDVDNSYLWHKIAGTFLEVGGAGSMMPLGGALGQQDIELIGQWIDEGAAP